MKIKTALVLGDLHVPYHDKKCYGLVKRVISQIQPQILIINGDLIECGEFSKYAKPLNLVPWEKECVAARKILRELTQLCPRSAEIHYLFGNHEFRYDRWLMEHGRPIGQISLHDGEHPLIRDLKINLNRICVTPWHNAIKLGSLSVTHGNIIRKHSAYTAKATLEEFGESVLVNHTHRGGSFFRTTGFPGSQQTHAAWENFCLCQQEKWYTGGKSSANWQQGFSLVHFEDRPHGFFQVVQVPIVNHRFVLNGKRYK